MSNKKDNLRLLLLAGGKSQRMGKDKASLIYNGKSQMQRMVELVTPLELEIHMSLRSEQSSTSPASVSIIYDHEDFPSIGPMGGILSAFKEFPDAAFLVIACDLPFLDLGTLEHLISNRDNTRFATAYQSHHDSLPEPLCAIWESLSQSILLEKLKEGIRCPRKILIQGDPKLLELPKVDALDNINTPKEYEEASRKLSVTS